MVLVGLIPARGGSKGIPRKNLAPCAGRPLLAWTAEAALGSGVLTRVILSTDDEEIAAAGRSMNLETPFMRPREIADDSAPMLLVLRHALEHLRGEGLEPDAIVLLQPTSPLRGARHIAGAVDRFQSSGAATLVSTMRVPHQFAPASLMRETSGQLEPYLGGVVGPLRRQDKELLWARNGPAILIVRREVLAAGELYGDPTIGYPMDERSSVDVDEPADLRLADLLLRGKI